MKEREGTASLDGGAAQPALASYCVGSRSVSGLFHAAGNSCKGEVPDRLNKRMGRRLHCVG